jgi:hypothetical protein
MYCWKVCLSLGFLGTEVYSCGTDHLQNTSTVLLTTQLPSNQLQRPLLWCSYYCCKCVSLGVYRIVAWQWSCIVGTRLNPSKYNSTSLVYYHQSSLFITTVTACGVCIRLFNLRISHTSIIWTVEEQNYEESSSDLPAPRRVFKSRGEKILVVFVISKYCISYKNRNTSKEIRLLWKGMDVRERGNGFFKHLFNRKIWGKLREQRLEK